MQDPCGHVRAQTQCLPEPYADRALPVHAQDSHDDCSAVPGDGGRPGHTGCPGVQYEDTNSVPGYIDQVHDQ